MIVRWLIKRSFASEKQTSKRKAIADSGDAGQTGSRGRLARIGPPRVSGAFGAEPGRPRLERISRVTYTHDSWCREQGHDPRVRALADKWNVRHFSRAGIDSYDQQGAPFQTKTNAGNVNAWLDACGSSYDIFVQFDIDHAPL